MSKLQRETANRELGVAYVSVLSGLIQLISACCQVGLQRVFVVRQPINLTPEVFLSLLTFVLLILQCLNLKVAFVDVLQQPLNLSISNSRITSAKQRWSADSSSSNSLAIIRGCRGTGAESVHHSDLWSMINIQ